MELVGRTRFPYAPIALLVALLAALALPSTSRAADAATQASEVRYDASEVALLRRINDYRASHGQRRLRWDQALVRVGRRHACEMRADAGLSHQSPTVIGKRLKGWTSYGENVGWATDVPTVWRAFLNSPHHTANILYPWGANGRVGVGIRRDATGLMWITMGFTKGGDPTTTLGPRADSC
jgi:uncharacterized protein YkwD